MAALRDVSNKIKIVVERIPAIYIFALNLFQECCSLAARLRPYSFTMSEN